MTQPTITFYEIPDRDPGMVVRATCKLVTEYYRTDNSVHILTQDEDILATLDDTLWNFPIKSFVPHVRASAKLSDSVITMDFERSYEGQGSVLVNLANEIPSFADQFDSICEFVMQDEEIKQHARRKFARYREIYSKPHFVTLADWDNSPMLT